MSNTKLFVGNISFNTTENDLQDAFSAHGTVVEANLMMDRMSGRPRGFGFVTMSTEEEAQKAIEAMNGASLDGRNLTVNIARPREEGGGVVNGELVHHLLSMLLDGFDANPEIDADRLVGRPLRDGNQDLLLAGGKRLPGFRNEFAAGNGNLSAFDEIAGNGPAEINIP